MTTTPAHSTDIDDLVDRLERAAVNAAESSLRRNGSLQPPIVHIILSGHPGGYVGFIESRPFYRGSDAAAAIRRMGFLPAAMYATRLVVTWEQVDLLVGVGDLERARAVVNTQIVLDARRDGTHTMRVHPFDTVVLDSQDPVNSPVLPRWDAAERRENGRLPEPVEELLAVWREGFNPRQLPAIDEELRRAGYTIQLYAHRG